MTSFEDQPFYERTEGESSDTANKDVPPQQVELINAVAALGKPTIAVISDVTKGLWHE